MIAQPFEGEANHLDNLAAVAHRLHREHSLALMLALLGATVGGVDTLEDRVILAASTGR